MTFKSALVLCAIVLGVQVDGALKSVCYTNGGGIPASSLNPFICTHIIHTFLQPDNAGNIKNPGSVTGYLANLVALKAQNPSLKILIAFGGAGNVNADWTTMVANSNSIRNFATNVLNFMKANNIDGADMDWEYPNAYENTPADKANFGSLLKQLRATFGSTYQLSVALGASNWRAGIAYDLPAIFGSCDFVNIMTYDFNGWQWNGPVGLNAPLYSRPNDAGAQIGNNIDAFMSIFVASNGVDRSKIILGVPTYGHVFTLANSANNVVYSAGVPTGFEDYNSICQKVNRNEYTSVLDTYQKAPYAFAGNKWVGYESPASAAIKAQYIKDKNLGGAMFWSLESDDYSNVCGGGKFAIIATVYNIINGGSSPTTQATTKATTKSSVTTQATTKATTNASVTTKTTTKAPGGAFVCPGNGLFKNPSDCGSFYNCANGVAYLTACPAVLRYNSALSTCDWPANVVC